MRFKDKDIEAFWEGASLPRRVPPTCRKALFRKLPDVGGRKGFGGLAHTAEQPPRKLSGHRAGQYSIRVNQQWRLCFTWSGNEALEVEFCDYH